MATDSAASKLAWGILGTGNTARQFGLALPTSDRGVLRAVASRNEQRARAFASDHGAAAWYASYDELVAADDVEAVYIALPNTLHREWSVRALEAGKHVLCEKPLATAVEDAEAMFAAADAAGRLLVEGYAYRSSRLTIAVVEAVRRGDIGALRLVRASFCYRTRRIDGNIRFDPELGGGALLDVGCYCVDFARLIADDEPMSSSAVAQYHPRGVDEVTAGVLQFPGGLAATFSCALSAQSDNTLLLCGDEGYIAVPVPWRPPVGDAHYLLSTLSAPKQDASGVTTDGPSIVRVDVAVDRNVYATEADAFAAAVRDGLSPVMGRADSLGTLRALCALRDQIPQPA